MLKSMETHWPPRSPQEALLSSPSGRKRLRMYQSRMSPTPSPLKKPLFTSSARHSLPAMAGGEGKDDDDDDDEDEETLQLRLKALEARLKLKKLQQKKERENHNESGDRELRGTQLRQSAVVQVMVSPQKRIVTQTPQSPGRILLGIDKGLKGKNISLKRPPSSQTKKDSIEEDPFDSNLERGGSRHISDVSVEHRHGRSKTFSEKMAEIRQQDKEHKEKSNRLCKSRSTGFGVQKSELEGFQKAASKDRLEEPVLIDTAAQSVRFSREEVLRAVNKPVGGLLGRRNTISDAQNPLRQETSSPAPSIPSKYSAENPSHERGTPRTTSTTSAPLNAKPSKPALDDDPLHEHFSSVKLSKRVIPHKFLVDTFADKHISLIPSLLATIKSPTYELPSALEDDFIVLGVIASKSSPLSHKDAHKSTTDSSASNSTSLTEATDSAMNARGKYMVFTLTDLKWTLDLYLFTTAYTRFWKLTPGTLIAILNPSIMPPPPGKADTGRFSLVLNSSDDTILEIGTSRDLGWCKSVRKDGKPCSSWIDKRHTEFCEWHVDRVVESTRRGRMEVNGMSAPYAPGGKRGGRTGFWGGAGSGSRKSKDADFPGKENGLVKEGPQYDRASSTRYFIAPSSLGRSFSSRSAASLLDAATEINGGGAEERGGSREERLRKRLAEQDREREIARQLGEGGNGIGSKYLKVRLRQGINKSLGGRGGGKGPSTPTSNGISAEGPMMGGESEEKPKLGAEELGLKGRKAGDVKLGSVRKRLRDGEREKEGEDDGGGGRAKESTKRVKIDGGKGEADPCQNRNDGATVDNDDNDDDEDDLEII